MGIRITMINAIMVKGIPDKSKKRCFDCFYCKATVSWWCTNEEAINYRGTSIPGICDCIFWKPMLMKKEISFLKRLFMDYIEIEA